jgi:23S rRNA G2445 N2-methylase RlmL
MLYKELRKLSKQQLWDKEVARFDAASPEERRERVAVIRAIGATFAETGTLEEKGKAREWLLGLLRDRDEKIRRYAMTAMPKIGAGAREEGELLAVLRAASEEREKKFLVRTLGKIGGRAALKEGMAGEAEQRVKASIARQESPSTVRFHGILTEFRDIRINLRGRSGLELFVRDEVAMTRKFRVKEVHTSRVTIAPVAPFSLSDIYALRCFGTMGFVLGRVEGANEGDPTEELAAVITASLSRHLLRVFTEGAIRYRLNFALKGHQRAAVARLANRVYALCPEILNDGRRVTWTIDIYPEGRGFLVELSPNLTPDPRFSYRQMDVPAASHPPLAACLARLAGDMRDDVIWDPFCGSGLELIERAFLGEVRELYGTDRSEEAVAIARKNFAASKAEAALAKFIPGDFREIASSSLFGARTVSLIITNPPMGMRVPVADLGQLIDDVFQVAAGSLRPGGRLVMVNPSSRSTPPPMLKLQFQQKVDMGGFGCRMEKYTWNG